MKAEELIKQKLSEIEIPKPGKSIEFYLKMYLCYNDADTLNDETINSMALAIFDGTLPDRSNDTMDQLISEVLELYLDDDETNIDEFINELKEFIYSEYQ